MKENKLDLIIVENNKDHFKIWDDYFSKKFKIKIFNNLENGLEDKNIFNNDTIFIIQTTQQKSHFHQNIQNDIIYLIEVIEHCCDVHGTAQFIANHLSEDGIILMTTTLHPFPYSKDIINSWYITPRTGHVSIFSFESLFQLFRKHKINIVDTKSILVGKKKI